MKEKKKITSEKGTAAIEGNALHHPMLQILFYHLRKISLQWIFSYIQPITNSGLNFNSKLNIFFERERERLLTDYRCVHGFDLIIMFQEV